MARFNGVSVAMLVLALALCAHALELPAKKVPLTREQLESIQEHKQEEQFQAQVEALNDKVFPEYDNKAKGEWTHESADAMQKHWANIVDRDSGVVADAPVKHAVHPKPVHSKMAQAKHAAHKAMHKAPPAAKAAKHAVVHHPVQKAHESVKHEAAQHTVQHAKKWIKPHAKLWEAHAQKPLFARKPSAKEEAAAELAEFSKINDAAFPSEHATTSHHETADEMHARRQAEVNSAFPKRWEEQEEKGVVGGEKQHRGHPLGMDSKEVAVQRNLFGKRKFHSERMHAMELNSVMRTDAERASAAKTAQGELNHLAQLSSEVLPKTPAEIEHAKKVAEKKAALKAHMEEVAKAKAAHAKLVRERHAAHRAAMAKKREERMARKEAREHKAEEKMQEKMQEKMHAKQATKEQLWPAYMKQQRMQQKKMPQSSDTEVPSMGTDQVYLGAKQAGFAHKGEKHAHPKHAAKK